MPQILAEDAFSQTVQDDDGRIVVLPAGTIANANAGGPPPIGFDPLGAPPQPTPIAPPQPLESVARPLGTPAPSPQPTIAPIDQQRPKTLAPAPIAKAPRAPAPPPGARGPQPTGFEVAAQEGMQSFDDAAGAQALLGDIASRERSERQALIEDRNRRADEIERQRAEQAAKLEARRAELTQKYESAVDDAANHTIDENRRYHEMGTGSKVMLYISAALAGLGQAFKGQGDAPNPVLGMLTAELDRDVRAQMAEGERLRANVGLVGGKIDRFEHLAETSDAQYGLRMATELERTARTLEATAEKFGSESAQANALLAAAELRGERAKYLTTALESEWSRDMQVQQFEEQRRARQASAAQARAALEQSKYEFEQTMGLNRDKLLLDAAQLEQAGQIEAAKAARAQAADESKLAIGGKPVAITGEDGSTSLAYRPLVRADGSIYTAPDDTTARALRKQKAAVETSTELIDEIIRIREEVGWEADVTKSPEWQKMQANFGSLQLSAKDAAQLGVLSATDMQLLGRALGTSDPTEFRDIIPGLRQARKNSIAKMDHELRANNYDGETYDIPDPVSLSTAAKDSQAAAYVRTAKQRTPQGPVDTTAAIRSAAGQEPVPLDEDPQIPNDVTSAVYGLFNALVVGDDVGNAEAGIRELAKDRDPRMRAYVRKTADYYRDTYGIDLKLGEE